MARPSPIAGWVCWICGSAERFTVTPIPGTRRVTRTPAACTRCGAHFVRKIPTRTPDLLHGLLALYGSRTAAREVGGSRAWLVNEALDAQDLLDLQTRAAAEDWSAWPARRGIHKALSAIRKDAAAGRLAETVAGARQEAEARLRALKDTHRRQRWASASASATPPSPLTHSLVALTTRPLHTPLALAVLLEALEADPSLHPTHYTLSADALEAGSPEHSDLRAYGREPLAADWLGAESTGSLHIVGPGWVLHLDGNGVARAELLSAGHPDQLDLGERLLQALRPQVAALRSWSAAWSALHGAWFRDVPMSAEHGLSAPGVKTWLGYGLAKDLPDRLLLQAPAAVLQEPWGGLRLDLDSPEHIDRMTAWLEGIGLLGDGHHAGPSWQPMQPSAVPRPWRRVRSALAEELEGYATARRVAFHFDLEGQALGRADLTGLETEGLHAPGADFSACILQDAVLFSAEVSGASFQGVQAAGLVLEDTLAARASFRSAVLTGAQMVQSDLREACFDQADLRGADFTDSDLRGATFRGARTEGIVLSGCRLEGTVLS